MRTSLFIVLIMIGMLSLSMVVLNATEGVGTAIVSTSSDGTFVSYYDNVTVHDGDIVINGTQTVVIEDCNFTQNGNISITDMGKLIISNSTLALYGDLKLTDDANLTVLDSKFENPSSWQRSTAVKFHGNSSALIHTLTAWEPFFFETFDNSSFSGINARISDLHCYGYSAVSISDNAYVDFLYVKDNCSASISNGSLVDCFCIDSSYGNVSISDLKPGYGMNAHFFAVGQGPEITISESNVRIFDIFLRGCYFEVDDCGSDLIYGWIQLDVSDSEGIIRNSSLYFETWTSKTYVDHCNLSRLTFALICAESTFNGLVPGFYDYWNMYTNATVTTLPYYDNNVTLSECEINSWQILIEETNITVSSSELYDLYVIGFVCNVFICNSDLETLQVQGTCNLCFDNATVQSMDPLGGCFAYVFGNVTIGQISFHSYYPDSTITRCYSVVVLVNETQPVSEANLTLYGSSGLVWSGLTDETGQAFFNLTFTEENCTMVLNLETTIEQYSTMQNVTVLSATPVIVQFHIQGDANRDGIVDIFDAIILANAFNSIPVSPNWNPNADINGDNFVDIFDAIILANHFNQHYP